MEVQAVGLFRRAQPSSDDTVSLTGEGNAWWADRDELSRVFVPKKRKHDTAPEPEPVHSAVGAGDEPSFAERYSSESLFNWASSSEPDDPTFGGRGTALDPYEVLGLQPGSSLSEVVAVHRSLAKRYHPDQQHNADDAARAEAARRMTMVNAAYQELRSRLVAHRHTV